MAELQLLTALLTMHKSIGDILEAAQHEGGTIDVFEIQLAHEVVNAERARLLARPTPDAPTPTSRKRKGAPPTSDVATSRQEKKRAWALELYRSLPDKRPHPRGFAPGKKLTSGPGAFVGKMHTQNCPPCAEPYLRPEQCCCKAQGLVDCCLRLGSLMYELGGFRGSQSTSSGVALANF